MAYQKPVKVRGKILEIIDRDLLLVYVNEDYPAVRARVTGKQRMVYLRELVVGNELVFELHPEDRNQGRLARRVLDFTGL